MKSTFQLFFIIFLTGIFSTITAQQIDQNFTGIDNIEISTGASDCIVKKGTANQVNVKLNHTYGDKFKPTVEKRGNKLVIRESDNKGSRNGKATWTLSVPDGLDLKFNTGSGDFEAGNLELDLSLNAGSGDFNIQRLKGEVKSNTGSGDLVVEELTGDVSANAGSGDMEVNRVNGSIELNCGSGDIVLSEIVGGIEANVGSGDIEAEKVKLAAKSGFNSGSGDVSVSLASNLNHDISVNSGSGDATLYFNGNPINGIVIMTANKHNGKIHAPFAFDKEEEIEEHGNITLKKTAQLGDGSVQIKVGTGSGDASISD